MSFKKVIISLLAGFVVLFIFKVANMGLFNPLSKGLAFWGQKLGLPEMGISEKLGNQPSPWAPVFTPYQVLIGPTYPTGIKGN